VCPLLAAALGRNVFQRKRRSVRLQFDLKTPFSNHRIAAVGVTAADAGGGGASVARSCDRKACRLKIAPAVQGVAQRTWIERAKIATLQSQNCVFRE